jgi:hypothetical protein
MKLYAQAPLAYPALHVHLYMLIDTEVFVDESEHVALFLHGLLLHSFTSMLQFPPRVLLALLSLTVHCALYCGMTS